jgi:hypothetical protein
MYMQNSDVLRGQANGSRVFLKEVHVKTGEVPFELELQCGVWIQVFSASQVNFISVRHENFNIQPAVFKVEAENYTFTAKMKIDDNDLKASMLPMKGRQFGLSATLQLQDTSFKGTQLYFFLYSVGYTKRTGRTLYFLVCALWPDCTYYNH